jgi:hypothetical protein
MKNIGLIFMLVSLIGMFGCENKNSCEDYNTSVEYNSEVEHYIALLKVNQYDSTYLPAFTYKDIPALLKFRNETQLISDFPHNPISSLMGPDCKLGMFALWTIESIRSVSTESEYLILRFPSQNPILALRTSEELNLVYDEESQRVAAQAYYDWWYTHSCMNFDEFKNTDPLEKTPYKWH